MTGQGRTYGRRVRLAGHAQFVSENERQRVRVAVWYAQKATIRE
jgi:hypothetical protein